MIVAGRTRTATMTGGEPDRRRIAIMIINHHAPAIPTGITIIARPPARLIPETGIRRTTAIIRLITTANTRHHNPGQPNRSARRTIRRTMAGQSRQPGRNRRCRHPRKPRHNARASRTIVRIIPTGSRITIRRQRLPHPRNRRQLPGKRTKGMCAPRCHRSRPLRHLTQPHLPSKQMGRVVSIRKNHRLTIRLFHVRTLPQNLRLIPPGQARANIIRRPHLSPNLRRRTNPIRPPTSVAAPTQIPNSVLLRSFLWAARSSHHTGPRL